MVATETPLLSETTLRRICWLVLGRFEQLPKVDQDSIDRFYQTTMSLVRLTTGNYCTPRKASRERLENLFYAIGRELDRQRKAVAGAN